MKGTLRLGSGVYGSCSASWTRRSCVTRVAKSAAAMTALPSFGSTLCAASAVAAALVVGLGFGFGFGLGLGLGFGFGFGFGFGLG